MFRNVPGCSMFVDDLKKLLLQNGYPQGIITFNINDFLNKNKNKPNKPVATVPKKDVIVLFPYIGPHSNRITKRLKSLSTGGPGRRDTCHLTDFSQTFTDD